MIDIKLAIAKIRYEQGWSLQRLSEDTGVPKRTLVKIEQESGYDIRFADVERIATALGMSIIELIEYATYMR